METLLKAGSKTIRKVGAANLLTLGLLAVALACLIFGMQGAMKLPNAWRLFAMALAGLVFGWLLARTRLSGWATAGLVLAIGGAITALGIGRLGAPSGRLAWAGIDWLLRAVRPEQPDQEAQLALAEQVVQQAWTGFTYATQTLLQRSLAWLQALVENRPVYDPVAVLLIWSLVGWLVAAWAGWWLQRREQPLVALAPAGFLLAMNLAFSRSPVYALIVFIGTLIALQALSAYRRQSQEWQKRSVDRADLEGDWSLAIAAIVLALMSLALFTPSISIQQLAGRIAQALAPQVQASDNLLQALGIQRQPGDDAFGPAQNPGLPNQRLLGAGAELSQQVVLWVSVEGYQPPPDPALVSQPGLAQPGYYWRRATYERYTGRGWATQIERKETIPAGGSIAGQVNLASNLPYQAVRQHIQAASGQGGLALAAGELLRASEQIQAAWRGEGDLFAAQVNSGEYTVDSRRLQPTLGQLRQAGVDYPDWVRQTYLAVPESVPARVWELAINLTAAQPTPYDRAMAIQEYLRRFPYTLEVSIPPRDGDVVDYFLFDLQRGYCDHYASAMVILARAAGLPARLVVGYANGSYLPAEGRFAVTAADAHAWPEIYFPGYGWIEFEPTASLPVIDRPLELEPQEAQSATSILPPLVDTRPGFHWASFMRGALLTLAIGFLLLGAWALGDRLRLTWLAPSQAILVLYRRYYRQARPFVAGTSPSSTPYEQLARLGQRLSGLSPSVPGAARPILARLQRLTEAYVRMAYSPQPAAETDKQAAIADWWNLRFDLLWARLQMIFVHQSRRRSRLD